MTKHTTPNSAPRPKGKTILLSKEEEFELIRAWLEDGDQNARFKVVEAHRPMVLRMASRFGQTGAEIEDLVQEGMFGLMVALDKFDLSLGYRFSSFSRWEALSNMQVFVNRAINLVKLGQSRDEKRAFRMIVKLRRDQGAEPTTSDLEKIAEECGLEPMTVEAMYSAIRSNGNSLNINPMADSGADLEAIDLVVDDDAVSAESHSMTHQQNKLIRQALKSFPDGRAAHIIRQRWLKNEATCLVELGEELAISAERVRQIEKKALEDVRYYLEQQGFTSKDLLYAA